MSAQIANSDRTKQPLLDDAFYVGLLLRRAGCPRATTVKAGATPADKIIAEIGWVVADSLMAVKRSQPPKSLAFLACFEPSRTSKHLPLDAAFEMFRQTLQRLSKDIKAICGSEAVVEPNAGTEDVCRTALLLIEELKSAHDAGKLAAEAASAAKVPSLSENDLAQRIQLLEEREMFIQKMEERLLTKAQEQQEREMMLDQRAEDLTARAARVSAAGSAAPIAERPHEEELDSSNLNAGTMFEGREPAQAGMNEFKE